MKLKTFPVTKTETVKVGHTHRVNGPVCKFRTVKECDDNWRDLQQARKAAYELGLLERAEVERARRQQAYEDYAAKEATRIALGGPPV